MKEEKKKGEKSNLLPSYYYIENGLLVFTKEYHIDRGYCCGKGCKHCCFWPRNTKGATEIKLN